MTAQPRVRIALVGLGWVAQARHIPALRRSGIFELAGVIDRSRGHAATVAAKFAVPRHAEAQTLRDVPWIREVDALSIATAPMAHHDLVCEALSLGLHVITEKPFAMSRPEGQAMLAKAEASNRHLAVVHNFQFARSMHRLLADIESGRLGIIRGVRAVQLGNPRRRLPKWYGDLPLGLFYDESPHLLYLLRRLAGPLTLAKSVVLESADGSSTPTQIDAWFSGAHQDYPVTMSCNFESAVSEWYVVAHGEKAVGIVDIFRDIYLRLPNDGTHATGDVIRTSIAATVQHWLQHVTSGLPHLAGRLLYGNDVVFGRFGNAVIGGVGEGDAHLAPINASVAYETLALQHDLIEQSERIPSR